MWGRAAPDPGYPTRGSDEHPGRGTTTGIALPKVDVVLEVRGTDDASEAAMTTLERTPHATPPRKLRYRLAGVGKVVLALACIEIVVVVARYLSFDPDV